MTDWMAAAAGDETLAEELRTGTCRCGKMLSESSPECRVHPSARLQVSWLLRSAWTGVGRPDGPRGEDLELLGRFLPKDFLFAYEVLVHRGLVITGGAARGGRGYDESVIVGAGKGVGGMGAVRSGEVERRIGAGGGSGGKGGAGSGKPVIRSEEAVLYRRKVDRKLRRLAKETIAWIETGKALKTVRKCTGRKCGRFAEEDWVFCPRCGAVCDDYRRDEK